MRYTILLLSSLMIGLISVQAQEVMTPEKLWDLGRLSGAAASLDGEMVLTGITRYDVEANTGNRDLYLVDVAKKDTIRLTDLEGSEYDEQWHPDGQKIGFIATGSGLPQLYEINRDGSGLRQVTSIVGGITHFGYAPSGDKVWYTAKVQGKSTVQTLYPDLPKANARIIDDLMYRHWDRWDDYANSHLFIADYSDGKLSAGRDIMAGEPFDTPLEPFGDAAQIAWAPTGQAIVYTCKKLTGKAYAESTNSDLYWYDVATDTTINLTQGMEGYDRNPVFSPSGKYLLWNSMQRAGFESDKERLFLLDVTTGEKRELAADYDGNITHPVWSADEENIYFITGVEATYQIYTLDVAANEVRAITEGIHNYTAVSVLDKNHLVGTRMDMNHPNELYHIRIKNGEESQLTSINAHTFNRLKTSKVERRWITTTDGQEMLTWVIYPPDFDSRRKYPTLLYCQGGPQSAVSQFYSFRWNFQLMAAKGYIIVAPNRRGLPSFGQEWNDQISKDWGGQNMKDYLSAIDAVKQEPYVDANRLGAVGASYGGYSVYWLAGNHGRRFKAFIAHCGLFNLESWYGTTEELFFANWDVGGPYWELPMVSKYAAFSPHHFVQKWNAPILVIHGEKDFRVPVGEGMQAFQAAQVRNIPSRFLYFPEEGHWVQQPQNGLLWHRVFFDWLKTHL